MLKQRMAAIVLMMLALNFLTGFSSKMPDTQEAAESPTLPPQETSSLVEEPERKVASDKELPFLSYEEIIRVPGPKLAEYYFKLYEFMAEMERFQYMHKNGLMTEDAKAASLWKFIDSSYAKGANYEAGSECLIGGYWGEWKKKPVTRNGKLAGYRLSCDSENRCALPGDNGAKLSGHKCRPAFFTYYSTETRQAYCVDVKKDLTQSGCINVVQEDYKKMCRSPKEYCRPFADHFKRSLMRAIEADAKYQGMTPSDALKKYRDEVFSEYRRIYEYCGKNEAEWNRHSAGQNYSCFKLMSLYGDLDKMTQSPEIRQSRVREAAPAEKAVKASGRGLGIYACIQRGLAQAGISASDKYLALLAVEAKRSEDQRNVSSAHRVKGTVQKMIHMVTAVGVCSPEKYKFASSEDAAQVEQWLSEDKIARIDTDPFKALFGIAPGLALKGSTSRSPDTALRQSNWDKHARGTAPHSCARDIGEPAEACIRMFKACGVKDGAESCQQLPGGPADAESETDSPKVSK